MGGKPQWPTATWQIVALTNSPDENFLLFVQGVSKLSPPGIRLFTGHAFQASTSLNDSHRCPAVNPSKWPTTSPPSHFADIRSFAQFIISYI